MKLKCRIEENRFPQIIFQIRKYADEAAREAANEGLEILRLDMAGPKSGRVYKIRGFSHQASAPGETPAILSGELASSVKVSRKGWGAFELAASAAHAMFLEFGTSKMAARPFMKPVAELIGSELQAIATRFLTRIR